MGGAAAGLPAALRAALEQHPTMRAKRAAVAAKGYAIDTARAQRLPTLSAQASATSAGDQPLALRARQPLWAFGRIDAGIAFAQVDLTVEQTDLLRVQRQLVEQTATAYGRVRGVWMRLAVSEDNVRRLQDLLARIERRAAGELASVADVRLAQSRITQALTVTERSRSELVAAQDELLALTQSAVAADLDVPAQTTDLPAAAQVEALALAHGADLAVRQRRIELARAEVERERTAGLPTVFVQADRQFGQGVRGPALSVTIEGALEGLGRGDRGRFEAAQARLEAAREDLRVARVELLRNVRAALNGRDLQQSLLRRQASSLAGLEDLLASYQRQYDAGTKSWLDVLNMQRELADLRLQLATAQGEWLVHSLRLAALTGQLDPLGAPGP